MKEVAGYFPLKKEQKDLVIKFMSGNDVFVALPTGFGKSACYGILPKPFNSLKGTSNSIVVVISPLSALMHDQVSSFKSKGIKSKSAFVNSEAESIPYHNDILEGKFQLVFISPESLLLNRKWRDMLLTSVYKLNLVAIVVDEAHCVIMW